jgi:hypothetical protein
MQILAKQEKCWQEKTPGQLNPDRGVQKQCF